MSDENEKGTAGRALSLEELIREVDALRAAGKLPTGVTREERISWVYGNCVLANPLVTREMVEAAVDGAGSTATPQAGGAPGLAGPLIDVPGPVEVLGAANAYEPRPALCLQPMTHGDARYAEGRRAGLREAWEMMCDAVDALPIGHASRGIVADALLGVSVKLSELAGES